VAKREIAIFGAIFGGLPVGIDISRKEAAQPGHLGTPEQQRACRPDVQRFCREVQNQGDYAIADCLKTNERRLSSACRRVIEAGSR